jgi:phosphohistidine swiveling domain-containing protein
VRRAYVRGIADADAAQIGGKARSLRYLKAHGFTIPDTYVCDVEAYERYRAGSSEVLGQVAEELAELVGERSYAVRSSANVEDGVDHSFAGQFKSCLNVQGLKRLVKAIEAVWQSTSSNKVRAYAEKTGAPVGDLRMAVIIQEMVEPHLSGVVFSKNPSTGLDEVIVETVQGLGSQLVSHGTTPDKWVYKWGGWTEEPAEREGDLPIIEEVVRGAKKAERRRGGAVNLEWAYDGKRLYWLQLRTLTTIEGVNIYSNRIAKEFLPGMIKPLVWSINVPTVNSSWKRLFVELIGDAARSINIDQLARAFYYRAYFNMGVIGDLFALLGMPRESIELLLGIDVPGADPPRPRPSFKTIKYVPRALLFAARRVRILKDMDAFLVRQRTVYERYASVPRNELTEGELIECLTKLVDANKESSYFVITSQLLYALSNVLVKRLGRDPTSISPLDFNDLRTELQDVDPRHHLSLLHDEFLLLPKMTREKVGEMTYEDLKHSEGLHDFFVQLTQFLNVFGHISDSGNDFSQVPWKETPEHIIKMITEYRPHERVANDVSLFSEGTSRQVAGRAERLLDKQAAKVRLCKEQIGFLYAYGIGLLRDYFLQLGIVLAKKGIFESPNDIFYLTFEEIDRTVSMHSSPEKNRQSIVKRKVEMTTYADITLPEVIIGEEAPPLQPKTVLRRLKGVAASSGYYQGRVTTVSGVQDFTKIHNGDVLVIPYSDVGWTPLFVHAGAVVSGAGGMLSHAAIVAREYRIPAVVSLRSISNLADGTTVAVDGFKGEVLIVPTQT